MDKYLREELKNYFTDIMDFMFEEANFGICFEHTFNFLSCSDWESYNYDILDNKGIYISNGCTKFVIMTKESDWVLKIPFDYIKRNYCEIEVKNYKKACNIGIQEAFCECYFLMKYNGIPCYIMKKAECNFHTEEKVFSDISDIFRSLGLSEEEVDNKLYDMSDEDMLYYFLSSSFSVEFAEKVVEFCEEENITDIHSQNIGYYNDMPIIFDYSGY